MSKRLMMMSVLLLCAAVACGGNDDENPPALPAATEQAVDRIVLQQLAAANLPGAVVLISIPGQGEMVKAYGKANLQTNQPRSAADPFRIASITKTFIGTVILQLVDDGLLALADPISKWYPSFPNGDTITIDHLLRMRSGTLADLKVYARALCTGTLLKPQTHAQRLQGSAMEGEPAFVQYGAGILHLGRFCGHNGTVFGFSSELFYLPEKDAAIVINVNRLDLDDHSRSTELLLLLTKQLFPQYVNW
jgi:CubicO group peptidase (beta-lactamase class C family)